MPNSKINDILMKLKLVMFQVQRVSPPARGHQAVGGAGGQGLIRQRCSFFCKMIPYVSYFIDNQLMPSQRVAIQPQRASKQV